MKKPVESTVRPAPQKSGDQRRRSLTPARKLYNMLRVLEQMGREDVPLDKALASHFAQVKDLLSDMDRAAIRASTWDFLRHYRRLLWWVETAGQTPRFRKLLLADLILRQGRNLREVAGLCKGGRDYLPELSDTEKRFLKTLEGQRLETETMPEVVRCECPDWAEAGLREAFGERFAEEMAALNEIAPLDLRVNALKASREDVLARLSEREKAAPIAGLPFGLRLPHWVEAAQLDLYKDGTVEVQDAGSQVLAALVGAAPGLRVVDFCAGAGGKSLAMAAEMDNKGQLIACDVHGKRLQRAAQRFKRAGVFNAERRHLADERDPWVKKNKAKFDRVLVDAPCSGTGSWRRAPDSKWRRDEEDLAELVALQESILSSAARLVKPGGRLVYATCSLLPVENEQQIERFLRARPDFRLLPVKEVWAERLPQPAPAHRGDMLRLSPARDHCDGFFAAVLERIED